MVVPTHPEHSSLYRKHPVLSYMQEEITKNSRLQEYVNSTLENKKVPQSLTALYSEYFEYFIKKHFKERTKDEDVKFLIKRTIYAIGRLSYKDVIKKVYSRISSSSFKKAINTFCLVLDEHDDGENLAQISRGILRVERNQQWCSFNDRLIADYIVARYLAEECVRKFSRGRFKISSTAIRHLTSSMLLNGEVGRLLFGILSNVREMESLDVTYDDVFRMQCGLFPIIMEACRKGEMSHKQITSLAVDSIYENNNVAQLSFFIDEFTKNGVVNYTNACFHPNKIPYCLLTLGYFLSVSQQCYGVELANLGLDSQNSYYIDLVNNVEANGNYSIVKFNLSKNPIGPNSSNRLAAILNRSPQLSFLDLTDCKLLDSGFVDVTKTFSTICLISLKLPGNGISDFGIQSSLANLCYCMNLETLDLSNNNITDASIVALGETLPHVSMLRRLDISSNMVGNKGLIAIASNLHEITNLSHVLLQNNLIGEEGTLAFVHSVRRLGKCPLEYINLKNNKISPYAQMELQKLAFSCPKNPQVVVSGQRRLEDWECYPNQPPVYSRSESVKLKTRVGQIKEFESPSLTNARRMSSWSSMGSIVLRRTKTE